MVPRRSRCVVVLLAWLCIPAPARPDDCAARPALAPAAIHAVVAVAGEDAPAVAAGIAGLGANLVATITPPRETTAAAATAAGLGYLPRLSIQDVDRLVGDAGYLASVRAMPGIAGFQYIDLDVTEGYASPSTQARAYATLKALFPDRLVLYATRLDPIATDASYLGAHYRPEFTDLVTPYFYPVGTTPLGVYEEGDPWEAQLRTLLSALAAATPAGKPVLPVLQTFEQIGHPAGGGLVRRQLDIYREFWPANANVAAFWWGGPIDEPLVGIVDLPRTARGLSQVFGAAPSRPAPCAVGPRTPVQSEP